MSSFEEFAAKLQAEGFPEVLVRTWPALEVVGTHDHPFASKALIVSGEMWLTRGDTTQHLVPGDRFELQPHEPHAERYGKDGATYWVGRRPTE